MNSEQLKVNNFCKASKDNTKKETAFRQPHHLLGLSNIRIVIDFIFRD